MLIVSRLFSSGCPEISNSTFHLSKILNDDVKNDKCLIIPTRATRHSSAFTMASTHPAAACSAKNHHVNVLRLEATHTVVSVSLLVGTNLTQAVLEKHLCLLISPAPGLVLEFAAVLTLLNIYLL